MDVTRNGKRELNFKITGDRVSGGHLDSKGDPRDSHSFESLVKHIGGAVPTEAAFGEGLVIHPPNTFIPAIKQKVALGSKSQPLQASTKAKPVGLARLGGLKQSPSAN
jgi:hypothetical protein